MAKGRRAIVLVSTTVGAAAFLLVTATSSAPFAAGTLNLRATMATSSPAVVCPPEAPPGADCRARTGRGSVSGLGSVSAAYNWFFGTGDCPSTLVKPLATTGRFVVAGKGEIDFALSDGARCIEQEPVRNEPQEFTITGGSDTYRGASGGGTVERSISGGVGVERWTGTLTVAGLEFDVTPPTISGAVSKTVRAPKGAKRARVVYKVTASDAVDGSVAAACLPRSGSLFPIGRTTVTCQAKDSSGNTSMSKFGVVVRRT
jgi:hypothetical protein